MGFEVYERKSRPAVTDPIIGIQSAGSFSFNAAAFDLIRRHRPDDDELWVEVLFDGDEKIIGFRAVEPKRINSYPVRKQPASNSYLSTGKGFLRFHGVVLGKPRQYDATEFPDGIVGFVLGKESFKE